MIIMWLKLTLPVNFLAIVNITYDILMYSFVVHNTLLVPSHTVHVQYTQI